jgi:hypothetical protein
MYLVVISPYLKGDDASGSVSNDLGRTVVPVEKIEPMPLFFYYETAFNIAGSIDRLCDRGHESFTFMYRIVCAATVARYVAGVKYVETMLVNCPGRRVGGRPSRFGERVEIDPNRGKSE